jgi:hypothetical protein
MQIKHGFPPNYHDILAVFPRAKSHTVIFTYGDTIYTPYNIELPQPILAHEVVHSLQQDKSPDQWWKQYLTDKQFRLEQELEAHRAEYVAYSKYGRKIRQAQLNIIAAKLASSLYNNMIRKDLAKQLISGKVELCYEKTQAL